MEALSLFELNEYIRRVLALNFPESVWIRAEIAQCKMSQGHYYMDLVEKQVLQDEIIAQASAIVWSRQYRLLRRKHGQEFDGLLKDGLEVLLKVKIDFHERYGLKLMVEDIDPAFTIGKMELKRRAILQELQQLNLLEKNGSLPLPPVLQKIAVITSEKAAGYKDFIAHLANNAFGYSFAVHLFQASVQGRLAELEVISQLEKVIARKEQYDCVVIIRGGGAKLDLIAFDSLPLARAVAHSPLPVITGIGHEVDTTVLDVVAHTSLKTPTAVADFLIQHNLNFESDLISKFQLLKKVTMSTLHEHLITLHQLSLGVRAGSKAILRDRKNMLENIGKQFPSMIKAIIRKERREVESLEKQFALLRPENILKRGFSITMKEGKVMKSIADLKEDETLETLLSEGKIISIISDLKKD